MKMGFVIYGIVNIIVFIGLLIICWDGAVNMTIYPTLNKFIYKKLKANRVIQIIIDIILTLLFAPAVIIYSISVFLFALILIIYLLVIKGETL